MSCSSLSNEGRFHLRSGGAGAGLCGAMPCGAIGDVLVEDTVFVIAVDPPACSVIARLQHVRCDVNVADLSVVEITATFADGTVDVVWDGENFAPLYEFGSSHAPEGPGTRFWLMRRGGWRSALVRIEID